jgi:hypothetical protein
VRTLTEAQHAVDDRPKNFLTQAEMGDFLRSARKGRHVGRNYAIILLAYRHSRVTAEFLQNRSAYAGQNVVLLMTGANVSLEVLRCALNDD